jgi:hypothetical protein
MYINIIMKDTVALIIASKKFDLDLRAEETK